VNSPNAVKTKNLPKKIKKFQFFLVRYGNNEEVEMRKIISSVESIQKLGLFF
jgi:hypothetical protein